MCRSWFEGKKKRWKIDKTWVRIPRKMLWWCEVKTLFFIKKNTTTKLQCTFFLNGSRNENYLGWNFLIDLKSLRFMMIFKFPVEIKEFVFEQWILMELMDWNCFFMIYLTTKGIKGLSLVALCAVTVAFKLTVFKMRTCVYNRQPRLQFKRKFHLKSANKKSSHSPFWSSWAVFTLLLFSFAYWEEKTRKKMKNYQQLC